MCGSFTCVTHSYIWLIRMCDLFTCVSHSHIWLIHMCNMSQKCVWIAQVKSHRYVWLIDMCVKCLGGITQISVTHSHVWYVWLIDMYDSFTCVTHWHSHVCESFTRDHTVCVTHWHTLLIDIDMRVNRLRGITQYVWLVHMCDVRDSLTCVTHWHEWLIHMCVNRLRGITQYVWHDVFTRDIWIIGMRHGSHIREQKIPVTWLINMCDMSQQRAWHDTHKHNHADISICTNTYGTLQHTATHCNTLQHTATHTHIPPWPCQGT